MSHFSVNAIIPNKVFNAANREENVKSFIDSQLEKFYESLETPRYVEYTKEQLIAKQKKETEDYKNSTYAEYLKDPIAYEKDCKNPNHLAYLKNDFPKKLTYTDEQHYEEAIRYYEAEDIGNDGEVYSESNPNSKWDWYRVGGRWAGWLQNRQEELTTDNGFNFGTQENVSDNYCTIKEATEKKLIPFAIVTPDGEWHEKAQMGWFAITINENDNWDNEAIKIYNNYPEDYVVCVDCHI